ncbi:MAG: three-Cys-motif partner protein TcmP [Clostridia bacterium]|nr:three-Cys-motif partner protein TcmP [Clostridia bacterium]
MDLDVRREKNNGCLRCSNKEERHKHQENNGICKLIKSKDGLGLRCVGDWASDKIYYLTRYFDIFATGMHKKWPFIHYIEICCGPGRCSTRDGFEQDGTSLSIVRHKAFQYVQDALFVDYDKNIVDILNQRLEKIGQSNKAKAILGDYFKTEELCSNICSDGLTLCLVDPTDCSVPFDTIKKINEKTKGKCDFIISFFSKIDFNRNAISAYRNKNENLIEKYQKFVGSNDFFKREDVLNLISKNANTDLSHLFREEYISNLSSIGLKFIDYAAVSNKYTLLFASNNKLGLDFWKKSNKKCTPSGQRILDL